METSNLSVAKPFIKWAGGKDKLFSQLEKHLPTDFYDSSIKNYYEPFLGSGAVFFNLLRRKTFNNIVLSDINEELVLVYKVIQSSVYDLIAFIEQYKKKYLRLSDIDKEKFYYDMRSSYNSQRFNINHEIYSDFWVPRAAQMIFLNKTCYNGLYRQNLRGEFNVPFGKNYKPSIYDYHNLELVSKLLSKVEIKSADFETILDNVIDDSFIYLDPPYRPISKTSNFTDYYKLGFSEVDNERLMKKLSQLNKHNIKFMLNNSFLSNDESVEKVYVDYNISSIIANRMMSGVSSKRGKVSEIVVTNY